MAVVLGLLVLALLARGDDQQAETTKEQTENHQPLSDDTVAVIIQSIKTSKNLQELVEKLKTLIGDKLSSDPKVQEEKILNIIGNALKENERLSKGSGATESLPSLSGFQPMSRAKSVTPFWSNDSIINNHGTNWNSVVQQFANNPNQDILLYLYAPWCGTSRRIAKYFEEAAHLITQSEQRPNVAFLAVDCWSPGSCKSQNVFDSFPRLFVFSRRFDGTAFTEYTGGLRSWEIAQSYLLFLSNPTTLNTADDLINFINKGQITIVGYLPENSNNNNIMEKRNVFLQLSTHLSLLTPDYQVRFGITNVLLSENNVAPLLGQVKLFYSVGDAEILPENFSFDGIAKIISQASRSPRGVIILNQWTFSDVIMTTTNLTKLILVLPLNATTTSAHVASAIKILNFATVPLKHQAKICVICSVKFELFARRMGIATKWGLVLLNSDNSQVASKELAEGEFSADILADFMESFNTGNNKLIKSAPIAVALNDAKVAELSYDSLVELLREYKTPILLLVYTKWCGFCKAVMPIMEAIAEANPNVLVSQIDLDYNDLPPTLDAMVTEFPSIFLFNGGESDPIQFERKLFTLQHLNDFITENALFPKAATDHSPDEL